MTTVLEKIVADKRDALVHWKSELPLVQIQTKVRPSDRCFLTALRRRKPAFILECKQASPSKGTVRSKFDPEQIADVYGRWADCVSVLTEETHFRGHLSHLRTVRDRIRQPVLCKDFFIDEYQVWLARYFGADAILLMLSVLDDRRYRDLATVAEEIGLEILTEASDEFEVERALSMEAKIIGINNRDLHTLQVDLERTPRLAGLCQGRALLISESGYRNSQDLARNQEFVDGFLIGSSLMGQPDLEQAVRELIGNFHDKESPG